MSSLLTARRSAHNSAEPPNDEASHSTSKARPKFSGLLTYEQLPPWFQDNPAIQRGYRPISFSWRRCLSSIFEMHNESVNIWSHLVPAMITVPGQIWLQIAISHSFPEASSADRAIFSLNLFAATVTGFFSASYHLFMNHSQEISLMFLRIDYVGILTLILGSFFSGVFVGYFCDPFLQRFYWGMIVSLSLITAVLVLHPRFQGLKYRPHRTIAFVLTGLSGLAPVGHGLLRHGWAKMWLRSGMPYWFLEGSFYLVGAFFYDSKFPEAVWPGRFDLIGSSHQIFHVLVVIGGIVHMTGVWNAYAWNYAHNRQCVFAT